MVAAAGTPLVEAHGTAAARGIAPTGIVPAHGTVLVAARDGIALLAVHGIYYPLEAPGIIHDVTILFDLLRNIPMDFVALPPLVVEIAHALMLD